MNTFLLAVRNVKRSFKNYGIYFLTILIGVSLFYIFNSLNSQSAMMDLSREDSYSIMGIDRLMGYLSVFVAMLLGFLILYANSLLIRFRKKELGLYMTLGMKKGKISAILITETFLVGLLSLAFGIALGVFLSHGMALFTAKLFGFSVKRFTFVFSQAAALKSIWCFGLAFLTVMLFQTVNLNRQKLLDLIYADKKTGNFHQLPLWISVTLFCLSLGMLAVAYYLILTAGIVGASQEGKEHYQTISIFLGMAGTFLFFFSLSGFLLKLISTMPKLYYKSLNIFTLKQINSKIHTAYISMSFVCLMLFLAISDIAVGTSLAAAIREYDIQETAASAGLSYMAFYIGVVFLLTCASVLAISQLAQASDGRSRYELLAKLGAGEAMLSGSLLKQILIYFSIPLTLATAHSIVAIIVMSKLVLLYGQIDIFSMSLTCALAVVVIYGGYLAITYQCARKMLP